MTNLFHLIYLTTLLLNSVLGQSCTTIVRRPDIKELSPEQLTRFIRAVQQLNTTVVSNFYQTSTADHYNNVPRAHGIAAFFPWHRVFLRRYEQALQRIDPSVVLPYWDWSRDSQNPERSLVFTNSYFGGNGRSSDRCVSSGPFQMLTANIPSRHCLRRQFNGGSTIGAFYSAEAIESIIIRATSYDYLRRNIEGGPHGSVHVGIGGNNGDMAYMYSPNDPLFYMHHAFVDRLWYEWQQRRPTLARTYNGGSVTTNDNLIPFNVPVSSTFDTRGPGYCYYYSRYSGNTQTVTAATQSLSSTSLQRRQQNNLSEKINAIVKNDFNRISQNTVNSMDRSTRGKIRKPDPLPESYIRNNNLDVAEVRKQEKECADLVNVLNSVPDYRPVADID